LALRATRRLSPDEQVFFNEPLRKRILAFTFHDALKAARRGLAFVFEFNDQLVVNDGTLLVATRFGHQQCLKVLLAKTKCCVRRDHNIWFALLAPALYEHRHLVNCLCEAHACQQDDCARLILQALPLTVPDIVSVAISYNSILSLACFYKLGEMVQQLLTIGADPDDKNVVRSSHGTYFLPLEAACIAGNVDIVRMLIDAHATLEHHDHHNRPILLAIHHGHCDVVRLLLHAGVSPHWVALSGRMCEAPLSRAAACGQLAICELLLNAGARINDTMCHGLCEAACYVSHTHCMQLFLARGADPNVPSHHLPIFEACRSNNVEGVRLLLDAGAHINHTDIDAHTPLMDACKYGFEAVAKLLIARGADVFCEPTKGDTALCQAAALSDTKCLRLLLTHYTNDERSQRHKHDALRVARRHDRKEAIRLLVSNDPVHLGARSNASAFKKNNETSLAYVE
jgi:ankyrin repeat protein